MLPDFHKLLRINEPMYLLGDLNARHTALGHSNTNTTGQNVMKLISTYGARHIGPNFPTFIGHCALTTPDIILSNSLTYHNTHIEQGPLTCSDHLPIVFTISTTPIIIPAPKRLDTKRANWEEYGNTVTSLLPDLTLEGQHTETIDTAVDAWYGAVTAAQKKAIPLTSFKTLPYPTPSRDVTEAQHRFTHILRYAGRHGWTRELYTQSKTLQRTLQNLCKIERDKHWENTVKSLANKYSDPKAFWQGVKRLQGTTSSRPPPLNEGRPQDRGR